MCSNEQRHMSSPPGSGFWAALRTGSCCLPLDWLHDGSPAVWTWMCQEIPITDLPLCPFLKLSWFVSSISLACPMNSHWIFSLQLWFQRISCLRRGVGQREPQLWTAERELCTSSLLGPSVKGVPALHLLLLADQSLKYLLLGLKMKKALASGMGTAFSLRCSSDIGRGRGPTGISGSSSSSSAARSIFVFYWKIQPFPKCWAICLCHN